MTILKAGPKARNVIKRWEGIMDGNPRTVNLDPYICPAGYWTIGWGHVVLGPNGQMLRGQSTKALAYSMYPNGITMAEAEMLLQSDLIKYENGVRPMCTIHTTPAQFGAMVALTLNIGIGGFQKSSVARFHKAGAHQQAANAFLSWDKATVPGKGRIVLPGLVSRRQEERALYLSGS